MKKGFTLVEMLLVMGLFALLISIGSINYFSTFSQTSVGTSEDILIADLRSAQTKAMSGTGVSDTPVTSWGVKLLGSSYVIFAGDTYSAVAPSNYVVTLPSNVAVSTTFPNSEVRFASKSGEVIGYNSSADIITLTAENSIKNIELNTYGTITAQ